MNARRLYLVQHGESVPESVDPLRPLSSEGKAYALKTASRLRTSGVAIDVIWHSAKARAVDTARIFAEVLSPSGGTEEKAELSPNAPVDEGLSTIDSREDNIMIVGHLPFLGKLASLALAGEETPVIVGFRMGGAVCLERTAEGLWQIIFAIIPDLL